LCYVYFYIYHINLFKMKIVLRRLIGVIDSDKEFTLEFIIQRFKSLYPKDYELTNDSEIKEFIDSNNSLLRIKIISNNLYKKRLKYD